LLTGDANSSNGGSNGNANDACAESSESADLVPANLLFVVDKSGSMNCNAPPIDPNCPDPQKIDDQEPSKWEITRGALTGAKGALPTLAGQVGVSVGLIAFPLDDFCEVHHAKRSGDRPMPEGTVMLSPEHGASRRQNDPTVSPRRPIVPPGQGNRHGIVWGLYKISVSRRSMNQKLFITRCAMT
jgi:hypothetical protein